MTRAEALLWGRGDHRRITTRDFPPEVVALVDERLRGRYCVDCRKLGLTTPADVPLELDHLQPLAGAKGDDGRRGPKGDNSALNLTWKCKDHNRGRGDDAPSAPPRRPRWERRRRPAR